MNDRCRLQVCKAFILRVVCPPSSIIHGLMPPSVQCRQLLLGTRSALGLSVKPCTGGATAATPLTSATWLPINFSQRFSGFPLQRRDSKGNILELPNNPNRLFSCTNTSVHWVLHWTPCLTPVSKEWFEQRIGHRKCILSCRQLDLFLGYLKITYNSIRPLPF